ncbi:MAG: hypothetical protein ABUS47_16510 [Steroidobacter sp.]
MTIDVDAITKRLRESRHAVDDALQALATVNDGGSDSAAVVSLIERLAAELAARMPVQFPVDIDVWTSREVAAYLKCNPRQVLDRYAPMTSFPEAIRLPNGKGGFGNPKWHARDIVEWVEKFKGR